MTFDWERLADGVFRCRLPFLDVTVGVVCGRNGVLLVDTGTTLAEAKAIDADVQHIVGRRVTHIVLTHNHFDHLLGSSAFDGAETYCAPEVVATINERTDDLRADALRHGADADEVDRAIAALRVPEHEVHDAVIDLGDRTVVISHPGRGHTDHDLIVVVTGSDRPVVFCGDLVEESGDPSIDTDSDRPPGRPHWTGYSGLGEPGASSCLGMARSSTRRSSPRNGTGCAGCDEFLGANVTWVIALANHRGDAGAMRDLDFSYDLTLDEARRRAAVLEAIGDDWDPIAVLAEEEKAYDMLYSDLGAEQQRIYDQLVSAGVLPDRTVNRVAD